MRVVVGFEYFFDDVMVFFVILVCKRILLLVIVLWYLIDGGILFRRMGLRLMLYLVWVGLWMIIGLIILLVYWVE